MKVREGFFSLKNKEENHLIWNWCAIDVMFKGYTGSFLNSSAFWKITLISGNVFHNSRRTTAITTMFRKSIQNKPRRIVYVKTIKTNIMAGSQQKAFCFTSFFFKRRSLALPRTWKHVAVHRGYSVKCQTLVPTLKHLRLWGWIQSNTDHFQLCSKR